MKSNVNCSQCKFANAANTSSATNSRTIPTPKNGADDKIKALKDAGVDVSNLFSMRGSVDDGQVFRLVNGQIEEVKDSDPIFNAIRTGGTIPNHSLFRRWVMSQVFHMLSTPKGFVGTLRDKGYRYMWRMIVEEVRVQAKLEQNDPENFKERNRWFNSKTITQIAQDYINQLRSIKYKVRRCKSEQYIRLQGKNIFLLDIAKKVYAPLLMACDGIDRARNASELYRTVFKFYSLVKNTWLNNDIRMPKEFIDAYKGAGAYFTMKNLILFHNARFFQGCVKLSEANSIFKLGVVTEQYSHEGWQLFGVMKQLMADNKIDIEQKFSEWRKPANKYNNRRS